jgi:hypothetical protein
MVHFAAFTREEHFNDGIRGALKPASISRFAIPREETVS